jgi:hypothetical protein
MPIRLCTLLAVAVLLSACSSTDRQVKAPCGPLTSFVETSHCGEPQPVNQFTPFAQVMVE